MPYLVSECLEGRNLRERLKAGPMPIAEATAVALGVARWTRRRARARSRAPRPEAGEHVPEVGWRRQASRLRARETQAAARESTGSPDDTALSMIAGTAAYMAPEQARGESPDPRSDLFALGVMMYEMLAGQHPSRGADVFETLHAILTREPPDLGPSANASQPRAWSRIVMRLLQKAPDARFQSRATSRGASRRRPMPRRCPRLTRPARSSGETGKISWLRLGCRLGSRWPWPRAGGWLASTHARRPPVALTRFTWKFARGYEPRLGARRRAGRTSYRLCWRGRRRHGSTSRDLQSLDAKSIHAGTEGATLPFWSPDGSRSACLLHRRQVDEGIDVAQWRACRSDRRAGGARRGVEALPAPSSLLPTPGHVRAQPRVSADGGNSEPITLLDESRGETSHWWPLHCRMGFTFSITCDRSMTKAPWDPHPVVRLDRPAARAGGRFTSFRLRRHLCSDRRGR